MPAVTIKLRWDTSGTEAPYDTVSLDGLTPRARALAEAVAQTPLRTATDIWMEADQPIRDTDPSWQMWHTEEEADRPERRPWRGWAQYPADSAMAPAEYLETQARKIPPGWHILGAHPQTPVPSLDEGAADTGMTRDMVLRYLRGHGRQIGMSTWSAYVARGTAPGPARHVGRTPLWDQADLDAFLTGPG